jgi:hypothetical protein
MMLGGVVAAVQELLLQLAFRGGDTPTGGLAVVGQSVTWVWTFALAFVITALLRFPDGTRLGPRWRRVETALWSATVLIALVSIVGPGDGLTNPLEVKRWSAALLVVMNVCYLLWNMVVFVCVTSIVIRLRRSTGVERQQIKWVAFAVGTVGLLALTIEVALVNINQALYVRATVLLAIGILLIPMAMAIAMLRYRLYDVDRVVSRSVSYSLVAAVLALVYAGGVVGLQAISPASGNISVAGSTLAVAVLFNPVRQRVQGVVDRRFNRASYDAAREVDAFSSRLSASVDPVAITGDLGAVLAATIQPSSAMVWIRGEGSEPIASS